MNREKSTAKGAIGTQAIYDARTLGAPRMFVLGVQHMFAMFGATVLVPTLTGLSVSVTLLFAGLGTLLFHLLAKGKVPAFLGSSFAFIGGYAAVAPMLLDEAGNATVPNTEMLPYACFGVACAGLVYLVLAAAFKAFGVRRVMRFFPPIVTGPIIISIGLSLSSSRRGQLLRQLARGHGGHTGGHRLQHLGQGHGKDYPHPPRRHSQLCGRRHRRAGGLHRRARGALDRPPRGLERDGLRPLRPRATSTPACCSPPR